MQERVCIVLTTYICTHQSNDHLLGEAVLAKCPINLPSPLPSRDRPNLFTFSLIPSHHVFLGRPRGLTFYLTVPSPHQLPSRIVCHQNFSPTSGSHSPPFFLMQAGGVVCNVLQTVSHHVFSTTIVEG